MWYGAANAVPNGWGICDGTSGTPDLRDLFIVGAGRAYVKGATGGQSTVTLTAAQMPSHTHTTAISSGWQVPNQGSDHTVISPDTMVNGMVSSGAGNDQPHENKPPYYALHYIMKLP
ncbi:MAG: hypothetical protein QOH01_2405 [Verrucomicrobiota bacterium]|jgi:microcystin-dependent protein